MLVPQSFSEEKEDTHAAHLAPLPQALDEVIKWQFADLLHARTARYFVLRRCQQSLCVLLRT